MSETEPGLMETEIYTMKVDTQDFDGMVLAGMQQILQQKIPKIVMIELWPKSMSLPDRVSCEATMHLILSQAHGYAVHDMLVHRGSYAMGRQICYDDLMKGMDERGHTRRSSVTTS